MTRRLLPGFGSIDLGPAVRAAPAPQGDLLGLRALTARATGQCSGGRPSLSGSSTVASLTVLGVSLATDRAVSRTITIDSRSIDPSTLDPTPLAPPGVDLNALKTAIQPVLDALSHSRAPGSATFRFRTKVRFRVGNPRLFRTFTLPQYIDVG